MSIHVPRRAILQTIPALALLPLGSRALAAPQRGAPPASFPNQDPELVRAVVGESHRNLDRVRELVTAHPELAKASVDWGFGDWESALGAAAHTGRREIALFLMEHGARADVFVLAMLGHTTAVRAMVEASPGLQRVLGPHGIPLARHARAGGDGAKETLAYLESLGDADTGHTNLPCSGEDQQACAGDYACAEGPKINIVIERERLQFKVDGYPAGRTLFHQGDLEFHPAGAPSVRVRFQRENGRVSRLTVTDSALIAEAARV